MLAFVYNSETNEPNVQNGATIFAYTLHSINFLVLTLSLLSQSQLELIKKTFDYIQE